MSLLLVIGAALLAPETIEVTGVKQNDPIVCTRSRVHTVGTRLLSNRVCKPKSQWAVEERETQRELQSIEGRRINPAPIPEPR